MAPPSSTSSSERPAPFRPRVPVSAWAAVAVVLLAGAGLRALVRGAPGEPPFAAYPRLATEAYRYDAATGRARDEVVLIGSSLMRYGLQEELLAQDLGGGDLMVVNLGLDAASPWEELRLVESLAPSRATGQRLAIVEVNRISMDEARELTPYAAMRLRREGRLARAPGLAGVEETIWEQVPPRQDLNTWVMTVRDGLVGPHLPRLVPAQPPPQRTLWSVSEMARRRAVEAMSPRAQADLLQHRKLSAAPVGLGLVVAALKQRGFRVMILQTPLNGAFLDALAAHPGNDEAERAYRAAVLDPAATGADDVLAFDRVAEIGADDSFFADYGHLSREGSTLLTRHVAERVLASPVWRKP